MNDNQPNQDDNQTQQKIDRIERYVQNKIREYQRRALRNQKDTKWGRRYILISSWAATTLVTLLAALQSPSWDTLGLPHEWVVVLKAAPFVLNLMALVASLIASGLSTWLKTGTYEKKWEDYQLIYDGLQDEYFSYQSGADEYDITNELDRAKLLSRNARAIWTGIKVKDKTILADEPIEP